MIVVGLTGSIAMGKSETAKLFRARGIPVFDSDAVVHALYAWGGEGVEALRAVAPSAIIDDSVDRARLAALTAASPGLLKQVEAAIHPLVRQKQEQFLAAAMKSGTRIAVLDIPLLFETGRDKDVDRIVVVSAPAALQEKRALARPGMTREKLDFILSRQVPDSEKRARAHFVVDTSVSIEDAARQVDHIVEQLHAIESYRP
jgi:dephospho-CoA kinase